MIRVGAVAKINSYGVYAAFLRISADSRAVKAGSNVQGVPVALDGRVLAGPSLRSARRSGLSVRVARSNERAVLEQSSARVTTVIT